MIKSRMQLNALIRNKVAGIREGFSGSSEGELCCEDV